MRGCGWVLLAACLAAAVPAAARSLLLEAYDSNGNALVGTALLEHIAPRSGKTPPGGGFYVSGLDDMPAGGRPWLIAGSSRAAILWEGPSRVKLSFPWPVAEDGFSTVVIDNDGAGYADGERVLLNEAIALTQYRLFKESMQDRQAAWEPTFKPSKRARDLHEDAREAMAKAKAESLPEKRAQLYDKALTKLALAWSKSLFEHGAQVAAHPKKGPTLRWGLTLDETLASRVADFEDIAETIKRSGANWVRLVFRKNSEDFAYSNPRSFIEYDAAIEALKRNKLYVMGSVLDSTMWPRTVKPADVGLRARNLAMKYKETIRTWEVASEPNGNWLGGVREPLPDDLLVKAMREAAEEIKRIDPSLETVATLYWWEGTAGDDRHPTFTWLKRSDARALLRSIDVVGLSIYPDEHPMGLGLDPTFRRLRQLMPDKRLMISSFGYVESPTLEGYWWLDPEDVDDGRKDLVILYTGAAPALPNSVGGGFYWPALATMLSGDRSASSLYKIYRRTLERLGR